MPFFTKEEFCYYMVDIVDRHKRSEEWIDAVSNLFDAEMSSFYENDMFTVLLNIMIEKLDDKYGWLEYFFFERRCEWFTYEDNGETVCIDSYEKLYDLITERKDR